VTSSPGESNAVPSVDDLERRATAACLRGADDESEALWVRAHNESLANGDLPRAARCVFWLVLDLFNRREWARGNGWLSRGQHLLESAAGCPAQGLLACLASRNHLRQGEIDDAAEAARRSFDVSKQFIDADLYVFSRLTLALVCARRGEPSEAASLFDEIMVGVTVDNVSPIAVGVVYCAVIEACRATLDVSRAREWTIALDRWCATQPQMVAFRGKCLVHRSEILRQSGAWPEALAEAERACAWSGAHENSFRYPAGAAFYELGEVHRLRGEADQAAAAYRHASEHGQLPEPGLTLLYHAQGKLDQAAIAVRRLLGEQQGTGSRAEILLAASEILAEADDAATARIAANELVRMTEQFPSPALRAMTSHAVGAVSLAEGDLPASLSRLREAWMLWQELEIPYQAARVRVLIASVYRQLGDDVAAQFELDGARQFFERVSAQPDLARIHALSHPSKTETHTLSAREREVIELVATGKTNREIARALSISERTVDRHVSNILLKLDLPSRSAATAWAYQHDLIGRPG
jgi:DNA-binding CsgD family transcriptional regulator